MSEILAAVMGTHDVTSGAGGTAERGACPRRSGPEMFLDQPPSGFDRIEVVRVGRQQFHRRLAAFDDRTDRRILVRVEVVQHHDVAVPQMRRQTAADPVNERLGVNRVPFGAQREPALLAQRADQGQVVAPVHRPRFHIFLAAADPHVRAAHRQMGARFIDENQPPRIDAAHPSQECRTLRCHIRPVALARPRAFVLSTKPSRCSARPILVGELRWARGTRRLYSQHNSARVLSGASATTVSKMAISIGERQPPRFGSAATEPVARLRATHRSSVRYPTLNSDASSWEPPLPVSYAATARSRSASSYGSAMATLKYTSSVNSSAFWD